MEEVTLSTINWLAGLGATVVAFLIGGIWYGPIFGKAWMKAGDFTEEYLKNRNMGMVFGLSFLLTLVAAINLEMFIGPKGNINFGMFAGFMTGLGFVAMFLGILYLFEKRSLKLFLINAGYCIVTLTVMGAILGNW
ncbi:MAG: DUF1761 domain-containing protein [Chitinophagales bacterium]|nr:DUF1761 domain-containing protein [Chitinophagaceae bacterium]MCB9065813.1 DUF1761 domain-containing protein [Chitinophagales bacterium]